MILNRPMRKDMSYLATSPPTHSTFIFTHHCLSFMHAAVANDMIMNVWKKGNTS